MGKIKAALLLALYLAPLYFVNLANAADSHGSMVVFRNGDVALHGYVYKPAGSGPFPAIVYARANNKPIEESAPPLPEVAKYYTDRGFVFFVPSRRTNEDLNIETTATLGKAKRKKHPLTLPEQSAATKD